MGPVLSAIYIYTARPTAALKPHGACPLGTLYISWQQSRDSLVITGPTTNQPVSGLTMGERTGSPSTSTVTCRNCEKQGHFSEGNSRSQHEFGSPSQSGPDGLVGDHQQLVSLFTSLSDIDLVLICLALDRLGFNSSYIIHDAQRMSGH
jgi:hypothetical protein